MKKDPELYTFTSVCGRFDVTVRYNFCNRCNNASDHSFYDLINTYNITRYLHNPNGPAIINKETGEVQYWLNGENKTEITIHNAKFHNSLMDILDDN